ncbi:hypothetical protein LCGC14_1130120 [marine sediment metagenome]|uniref:Uncharacterized protein n=1 Tax=marine sediment metagenome TaxID=412755 RepID=A0A0F9Q723_9ZZZZ
MSKKPRDERARTNRYHQRTSIHEKNRFGTLPLDKLVAPTVGIFDEPTRCYQINHEWAAIIMGLVSLLTEIRMWQGATDEGFPAIREVQKFLLGGNCGVIDCDELEDCLETSPIIDAIVIVNYSAQLGNTQAHFDELTALYDGTAQSVGSEIPLTAPNLNSLHDNALCRTLELIVGAYVGGKGVQFTLQSGMQQWWQRIIRNMRIAFPIVPDYLWHLLGDELFGCTFGVQTALAALIDDAAALEVSCCLYDDLRGVSMTEAAFNAAIATCAGSLTGNAQIIACMMDGDNSQEHYLAFLEVYNNVLVRQNSGEDFVCNCAPDGWFWLDVDWDWEEPDHSGDRQSPIFSHTNPSNGELFSITARFQSIPSGKSGIRTANTGLSDSLVPSPNPLRVGSGLWMWENDFAGVADGRDAVGWPAAQFKDVNWGSALRQPDETFSFRWAHSVDLGHSRAAKVSRVRLLYKEV